MKERNTKIERFLTNKININPNKIVFDYLTKIIEYWEAGGKIRGSLDYVSKERNTARQALWRHINEVVANKEYRELFNATYPISPNSYLGTLYKLYFLEEE